MGNNFIPIRDQELKTFTNTQFKNALNLTVDADLDKITPNDTINAIDYFEETTNQKLYKAWVVKTFFGGSGWQGIINDLKPESYQIIRNVINSPFSPSNKIQRKGVFKREDIILRLYPSFFR